jgi:hypothetical protein
MGEHVDVDVVETSQQQVVDGGLKRLNIVEDRNGFRLRQIAVRSKHGGGLQ